MTSTFPSIFNELATRIQKDTAFTTSNVFMYGVQELVFTSTDYPIVIIGENYNEVFRTQTSNHLFQTEMSFNIRILTHKLDRNRTPFGAVNTAGTPSNIVYQVIDNITTDSNNDPDLKLNNNTTNMFVTIQPHVENKTSFEYYLLITLRTRNRRYGGILL